ncbi:hypothetical protein RFI_37118 [Reticulomyxa filosa]|uniref:Uncharacterized protein n=1 Tax=Reticulomyxa filosa TaxID=46433 RepID=X6LFJ1_RETFI|nr:hypothetical protein RFI_37118 [Reticulomyxa filosa]|eukprot:ETO00329.1 hypothetical protein RFI_37118 [Reticulomyxa filosa]
MLEKDSSKQSLGMQKCWQIVQTFQELTEDEDTTTLLKAWQQIANKDDNGSRLPKRNLRIYVCELKTNITSISLKDDEDIKCELQKIASTVFYKDFQAVQGDVSLCVQYTNKKKNYSIHADVSIFVVPTQTGTQNQIMAERIIFNHLLDGVKDVDTLKFILNAQKDIKSVIEKGMEQSQQELEKRIQQFETTEINLSSVLQKIYIHIYIYIFFFVEEKERIANNN